MLGGLISHSDTKSAQKVPLLGSIPLLGNLFKTRKADGSKNNLMIFIRPKILRDAAQAAYQTDSKYNYMMEQQKKYNKGELDVPILPPHKKPMLPPAPPAPPPGTLAAPGSPDEKARAAKEQEEFDAAAIKRLEKSNKPGSTTPPVVPLPQPPAGSVATPPAGATTHPDGEPPYATEPPGVLMPPSAPQPTPPPEGGKP